jgi:hypothetical protein
MTVAPLLNSHIIERAELPVSINSVVSIETL